MSNDWLREHGWLLDRRRAAEGAKPTHLLLDGGKARVPDESAGAFLNAYAIAVVRGPPPSLVELRTPVFRLFLDLDVRVALDAELRFDDVMRVLQKRAAAFFAVDLPRAVVCDTPPTQQEDGSTKAGRHVVWTNVWASASTALAYRAAVVEDLEAALPDACVKSWAQVVDACVFTSNGLRMPFSAKGRAGSGVYLPAAVWEGEEPVEAAVDEVRGVTAVRRWVRELSLRAFGVDETAVREGVHVPEAAAGEGLCGVSRSVLEYAGALSRLEASLPAEYRDSRFTGVIQGEACYLLRSSSRYCGNAGRPHNTCNIYFVLTLRGIRQGCYCRCDTVEGRRYGQCRDYRGETWPVPDDVLAAFFGAAAVEPATGAADFRMPSAKSVASASLLDVLSNSRPALKAAPRKRASSAAAAAAAAGAARRRR